MLQVTSVTPEHIEKLIELFATDGNLAEAKQPHPKP